MEHAIEKESGVALAEMDSYVHNRVTRKEKIPRTPVNTIDQKLL